MNKITITSTFHLVLLLSYVSIASVSAAIITPALPEMEIQYGLTLGDVEWVMSSFLIGYMVGQLLYAPLANHYGRVKALRIGLIINLLGILLCLCALNTYWLLIIGRLITALGAASGLSCTFMLINEWLPKEQRKKATSYSTISFALGVGVAVMIGGLITEYGQWQGCFWFLLIHGVVMLCGTCVFNETLIVYIPIQLQTILRDYSATLSSPTLVIYSLVVGCCSAIASCFAAEAPQIAHDLLHLSAAKYGYWNGINIIGMLLGGMVVKQLLDRFSVRRVVAMGFIATAVGIVSLFLMWVFNSESSLWFFLTTAYLYLFSSLLFSGGSYIASNALKDKANAAAMMSFINMFFATVCVILMGYLTSNPLLTFALILSLMWVLVVGLLFLQPSA